MLDVEVVVLDVREHHAGEAELAVEGLAVLVRAEEGCVLADDAVALGVVFCHYISQIQAFVEWATGTQVFSADIYFLSRLPAKIDWREVATIAGWASLMSFLATLPPALRASRLDPVEALRYE